MVSDISLLIPLGAVVLATLSVVLRWHDEIPRKPAPLAWRPTDDQPHTLTPVGSGGRVNPMAAETFATYADALARQRQLARAGHASIVAHQDSGEVRVDHTTLLGPFGRITY